MTTLSHLPLPPPSPSQSADELRKVAAVAAWRTFLMIAEKIGQARHGVGREIWREGRGQPGHEGSTPLVLDIHAHRHLVAELRDLLGSERELIVVSEEGGDAFDHHRNAITAIIDPLDGTGNARRLGIGYASVVVLGETSADGRLRIRAGAIASHNGLLSWTHAYRGRGDVAYEIPAATWTGVTTVSPVSWLQEMDPGDSESVAIVATGRRRFEQMARTLEPAGFNCTFGGNPLFADLITGGLGAIVELNGVSLRDAAGLLAVQNLDGVVTDLSGAPIDVYTTFCERDRIGPYIAASTAEGSAAALRRLRGGP